MTREKALLVVAGGRALPDVIALLCVQPRLVVYLTSEEGWQAEQVFVDIAKSLATCKDIVPVRKVNAYDIEAGKAACEQVCISYPFSEWEWTFTIGSAPKITGIAAYEIARQNNIPCLYIDTLHEKFVSLVKDIGISPQEIFHMTVDYYMKVYQRKPESIGEEKRGYRSIVEKWGDLASIMAHSPDTPIFTKLMRDKPERTPILLSPATLATSSLLKELERHKAIALKRRNGTITCEFTTKDFSKFLGSGDWLEVYVYSEAKKAQFADDCQWGYKITSTAENELDLALTYRAQLIIAECKTNENPFHTSYLDSISSKAEMLGHTFATKVFVTNASKTLSQYPNFEEQAKLRRIVVVTAENLPHIGSILKKQAENPDYPRI
jgi:hypothetical protein